MGAWHHRHLSPLLLFFLRSDDAIDEGTGGNVGTPIDDGAMGDHPLGLSATGGNKPSASPTALDSLDDEDNAPLEFTADVGLPAIGSGLSEAGAATDMGSGGTNGAPMLQSPLYPLFYCRNARSGWRLALTVVAQNTA
jgi:hypothetical protein